MNRLSSIYRARISGWRIGVISAIGIAASAVAAAQTTDVTATANSTVTLSELGTTKFEPVLVVESSGYKEKLEGTDKWLLKFPKRRSVEYPESGIALGQGWNSFLDESVASVCVDFEKAEVGGQSATVEMKRIHESDTLRKELEVSYESSAKAKFKIGGGGGSMKAKYVTKSEVNAAFVNLLVVGKAKNGAEFIVPVDGLGTIKLNAYGRGILYPKDGKRTKASELAFLKTCGDSLAATVERGAELYALYQFGSGDRTVKGESTLTLAGEGNYMGFSGKASTSIRKLKEVINKNEVNSVKYTHSAHRGLRLPYNEESIQSTLAALGSALELEDSFPFQISVIRYDSLPGWEGDSLLLGPSTREGLVAQYIRLSDLLETAERAQMYPEEFKLQYTPDLVSAERMERILRARLEEIEPPLRECQEYQEDTLSEALQTKINDSCLQTGSDAILTDLPMRAAMPPPMNALVREVTNKTEQDYDKKIAAASNALNKATYQGECRSRGGREGPGIDVCERISCARNPGKSECRPYADALKKIQREKAAKLLESDLFDTAETRYQFWIHDVVYARAEAELPNSNVEITELEMYRRDIYCQYGLKVDEVPCSSVLMPTLIDDGYPVIQSGAADVTVAHTKFFNTEIAAWNDIQEQIALAIAEKVGNAPHYFKWTDSEYTLNEENGKFSYSFTGMADIKFFKTTENILNAIQ